MWEDILRRAFSSSHDVRRVSEHIAEVPTIDLMGPFDTSPNGRFTLVWSDSDPSGTGGGYRESGRGRYALLDGEKITAHGTLERPNDGHVVDCGRFVLSDWMFGGALRSEFFVFDPNGEIRIHAKFSANVFKSILAPDGSHAACQLCNSDTSDGGTLALFDVTRRTLVAQFVPVTGWAQQYLFDTAAQKLGLVYPELGTFWYRFDGTLLDSDAWAATQIRVGSGFQVLEVARERLRAASRPLSKAAADEIMTLGTTAAERLERWPREQAKAERLCGEVAEEIGDTARAVLHYEKALIFDPKCGVKRRLEGLRKVVGAG